MAAELVEQAELFAQTNGAEELPNAENAMSTEDLIADFQPPAEPISAPADDLPEKYRGKSIKEVIGMHQEAEKLLGSQGNEVGELRKVVDQFILGQRQAQQQAPEEEPLDDSEFFENPQAAISKAIERHPEVRKARDTTEQLARATSVQQIQARHPDAQQVLSNPAFKEFCFGSPIRQELFKRANDNYDFAAADELMTLFKERHAVVQQTAAAEQEQRRQQVAQASTGGGSGSNTSGSKRIYRRADIIKLMKTDPDRYEALSPEIMQAYAEGRVR